MSTWLAAIDALIVTPRLIPDATSTTSFTLRAPSELIIFSDHRCAFRISAKDRRRHARLSVLNPRGTPKPNLDE